ncbi:HEPN domain-containing protein [Kocuria carniphila]|uniref:HEPN domain-containing protein n=1 Tax=Kocuria carniphila TaxID=262208 RepID=UPI0021A6E89F|nr:HEPN domain-containing protein [Kocuria carniphila]MCT1804023.1 HEPN domain-containing protein [Kocuria carniphila]
MSTPTEFDEFHRDLLKIEDLIKFVIDFRSFGANLPGSEGSSSAFVQAALDLHNISGKVRTDLPLMVGSLLLYACGRFEYFVGELVRSVADKEVAKADSYADIPKDVRESLRIQLLTVLSEPRRYSHLRLSDQQLAATLSSIVTADENEVPSDIPTEILASTDANMRPQVLKEVFARVGMKDVWGDISKQAPLRTHFGTVSESACKTAATNFLEELMRLRNSIAHPTASLSFPSPEAALEQCISLRVLSRAISDVAYLPR